MKPSEILHHYIGTGLKGICNTTNYKGFELKYSYDKKKLVVKDFT